MCQTAYIGSEATVQMMKDDLLLNDKKVCTNATIETVGKGLVRADSEGRSKTRLSAEAEGGTLNRVLHAPKVAHNVVSLCGLCNKGTICFSMRNSVSSEKNTFLGVGQRTKGINVFVIKIEAEKLVFVASRKKEDMLDIWHTRLAHTDRHTIKERLQKGVVRGLKMKSRVRVLLCTTYNEGKMNIVPMRSRPNVDVRPGVALHTDVDTMNVSSLGGAKCFAKFIDEASEHAKAVQMQLKSKAAKLSKQHAR